jgi:hypothetical protein
MEEKMKWQLRVGEGTHRQARIAKIKLLSTTSMKSASAIWNGIQDQINGNRRGGEAGKEGGGQGGEVAREEKGRRVQKGGEEQVPFSMQHLVMTNFWPWPHDWDRGHNAWNGEGGEPIRYTWLAPNKVY